MATEPDALAPFDAATRRWFGQSFAAPTPVQSRGWRSIASGRHTLMHPTFSAGVTEATDSTVEISLLLQRADSALYRAKTDGRARVVCYESSLPERQ